MNTRTRSLCQIISLLILCTGYAHAEVYKCTDKGKTVYSDSPCAAGSAQTLTDITSIPDAENVSNDENDIAKKLDSAVKSAINNGDMIRARALASTDEQRNWVNAAAKENKDQQAKTATQVTADKSTSNECRAARASLEKTTNLPSSADAMTEQTRLMHAACGTKEPTQTIYNNPQRWPYYPYNQYGNTPQHPSPPHNNNGSPGGNTGSPNPADYPKPKDENFGSRFIRPEDGILKY
ncbi:MAG: DUF4124 domain-containing protein [Methylophilaceae bacterium]